MKFAVVFKARKKASTPNVRLYLTGALLERLFRSQGDFVASKHFDTMTDMIWFKPDYITTAERREIKRAFR